MFFIILSPVCNFVEDFYISKDVRNIGLLFSPSIMSLSGLIKEQYCPPRMSWEVFFMPIPFLGSL